MLTIRNTQQNTSCSYLFLHSASTLADGELVTEDGVVDNPGDLRLVVDNPAAAGLRLGEDKEFGCDLSASKEGGFAVVDEEVAAALLSLRAATVSAAVLAGAGVGEGVEDVVEEGAVVVVAETVLGVIDPDPPEEVEGGRAPEVGVVLAVVVVSGDLGVIDPEPPEEVEAGKELIVFERGVVTVEVEGVVDDVVVVVPVLGDGVVGVVLLVAVGVYTPPTRFMDCSLMSLMLSILAL